MEGDQQRGASNGLPPRVAYRQPQRPNQQGRLHELRRKERVQELDAHIRLGQVGRAGPKGEAVPGIGLRDDFPQHADGGAEELAAPSQMKARRSNRCARPAAGAQLLSPPP